MTSADESGNSAAVMRTGGRALGVELAAAAEADLLGELTELVMETAPRRFGLCAVDLDEDDAVVLCRGLAFDDHAVVYSSGSRAHARFVSPDSAVRLLARRGDVRLLWVDSASDATAVDDPY